MKGKLRLPHAISGLAIGGIVFAAFSFGGSPFFGDTNNFVLFATNELKLEKEVQVSSGDLGSNEEVDIQKDVIINGNLFADEIEIDKNTVINGSVSANKLGLKEDGEILGTRTDSASLPIANLPEVPVFTVGDEDLQFQGQANILNPGSFAKVTLEKDSKLVLTGGTYNISRLILEDNSTLIYSGVTTLNIQQEFKGQDSIAILPGQNLVPDDLTINYEGKKEKKGKGKNEHDDDKKKGEDDNGTKPIVLGRRSFLNFKLLAPRADVRLGDATTFRGQILAQKIKVGKGSVLSRNNAFVKDSDPAKIVVDQDGSRFLVNEILIDLNAIATELDAQDIAVIVGGRLIGFVESSNTYQVELLANTAEELETMIQTIRTLPNSVIEGAFRNYIFDIF
ncbi:MAG: hypothetical protein WD898_02715 [Candidatus Paceibacterota bacterium]